MISYSIKCFICKHLYEVDEKHDQYQAVKRNMKANHICPSCIEMIEMDARNVTGLSRAMLEEADAIALDRMVDQGK